MLSSLTELGTVDRGSIDLRPGNLAAPFCQNSHTESLDSY